MRYLGVDYGQKRIGLALSDSEGRLGLPYGTAQNIDEVSLAAKKEGVGKIVIGLPMLLSGGESAQTREVRRFAIRLKKILQLPVEFESEIFTTKIAGRHSKKDKADASAAALILQSYLDKKPDPR